MKYMLMFVSQAEMDQAGSRPGVEAMYARIGEWFDKYGAAGVILDGEELQPARTATTVDLAGSAPVVTDGPFIEAKESIGGYAVVEVADLDAAIAMAKTWPTRGKVEIRPVAVHDEQPLE